MRKMLRDRTVLLASTAALAVGAMTAMFSASAQAADFTTKSANPTPQAVSYGSIGNYHSGLCLTADALSGNSGTQDSQEACDYGAGQEWGIRSSRTVSGYTLYNIQDEAAKNACLDLAGGSRANGAHIIAYKCNPSDDAQLWYLVTTAYAGWFNLVNWASGTCMTVSADSQSAGAKIQGWSCATSYTDHSYYWEPHSFP
jgi:Ricin-type beta-trefoil lectin domain